MEHPEVARQRRIRGFMTLPVVIYGLVVVALHPEVALPAGFVVALLGGTHLLDVYRR